MLGLLGGDTDAGTLLDRIRQDKPRYARDQFLLIQDVVRDYDSVVIQAAIKYCVENELWSAVDFRAVAEHFFRVKTGFPPDTNVNPAAVPAPYRIKPETRDIKDYVAVCGGVK